MAQHNMYLEPVCCKKDFYESAPTVYARKQVASGLFDINAVLEIQRFSPNAHVIDMGCGSGYNAWLLSQVGMKVCAIDTKDSWFPNPFFKDIVYGTPEVTDEMAQGVLMYIWPVTDVGFPGLEEFIAKGGKRVIVGGDHSPDHCCMELPKSERPPICPNFPPPSHAHLRWRKVKEMEMPVYSLDMKDVLQFFILE